MKSVGILTSGGDAPGMNACIRAAVRASIYYGLQPYGIYYGYDGMINGNIKKLESKDVSNIIQRGGTILKSARSMEFKTKEGRKKAHEQLQKNNIESLVVIGGDGSFTGAHIFYEEYGVPVIGVPGTIDNDLFGTDFTIGYDTAVNTAIDAIDKIRDTANSHDRIFFIEVMGRDSGYIAIQTAIAGGAELAMVPETRTTIDGVIKTLTADWNKSKTSSIVVVAEGDEEGTAMEIAEKVKAVSGPEKDIKVTVLGHIQRGGSPVVYDRLLASKLGVGAIEGLKDGYKDVMVGVINYNLEYTPIHDSITKRKPLNKDLLRIIDILSI